MVRSQLKCPLKKNHRVEETISFDIVSQHHSSSHGKHTWLFTDLTLIFFITPKPSPLILVNARQ